VLLGSGQRWIFAGMSVAQELVSHAKAAIPRCLTPAQRNAYGHHAPIECVEDRAARATFFRGGAILKATNALIGWPPVGWPFVI
jgi:hypothetical protein